MPKRFIGESRAVRPAPKRPLTRGVTPPADSPPLPPTHPAILAVFITAAACVLASVTFRIIDSDFWQHLAVGRAIWETHTIPRTEAWSWPTWGEPVTLHSWLFRALLWPFWQVGGLDGLFAWRWLTTLAAFGLALATARRMGARGHYEEALRLDPSNERARALLQAIDRGAAPERPRRPR